MIEEQEVFEAARRGYGNLSNESDSAVVDYFGDVDGGSWSGHPSNIRVYFLNRSFGKQQRFDSFCIASSSWR